MSEQRAVIIEDEYLVAMDLEDLLAELGHDVVATAADLDTALQLAKHEQFDFAILDVNLAQELSFPVADVFMKRKIPFLFATAYPPSTIPEPYKDVPKLQKPVDARALKGAIVDMFGDSR